MMIVTMLAWQVFACGVILGIAYIGARRIRRGFEADNARLRQELNRTQADRVEEPETDSEPAEPHGVGA